jgi:hypothetical protein
MTRKDYIAFADALGRTAPKLIPFSDPGWERFSENQWVRDVCAIAEVLHADNPLFNMDRFKVRIAATAAKEVW